MDMKADCRELRLICNRKLELIIKNKKIKILNKSRKTFNNKYKNYRL